MKKLPCPNCGPKRERVTEIAWDDDNYGLACSVCGFQGYVAGTAPANIVDGWNHAVIDFEASRSRADLWTRVGGRHGDAAWEEDPAVSGRGISRRLDRIEALINAVGAGVDKLRISTNKALREKEGESS